MNEQPGILFWVGLGLLLIVGLAAARREIMNGSASVWWVVAAWAVVAGVSYLLWMSGLTRQ